MSEFEVPGYGVLDLLGFGTSGEVWRARERSSGSLVVLRRLAGGDRAALAAVKGQAIVVRSLPTAHLVRLRTTTRSGRDDVLVLDHASGGSLAGLLLRRGRLEAGEVVTAVAPLAEALGQAHALDLVHGRLSAASVLMDAQGKPLLDGLGLAALHDPEDGLDPTGGLGAAADVWALGALAHQLLTGAEPGATVLGTLAPRAPLPLVRAIESALGFDPTTRPSAADLAAALLAACPPLPIEGVVVAVEPPAGPPSRPVRVRRSASRVPRPGPSALVGAVVLLVLAVVVAAGWAWGRHAGQQTAQVTSASVTGPSPPLPSSSSLRPASVLPAALPLTAEPALAATDWRAVLERLDSARSQAFARADASRLAEVYAPGAAGADETAVRTLHSLSRTALGVEHEIASLTAVAVTPKRVALRVVEALGAFEVLDGAGRVVEAHAAGAAAVHRVVLVSTSQGWRIAEVRSAA